MSFNAVDAAELRRLEEDLLRPEVRRSDTCLDSLITDDFIEYGSSGRIFGKRDVLDAADRLPDVLLPLSEFSAVELSSSVALVTYRSVTRMPDGCERHALRSSIWVRSDAGDWRITFHQGTPTANPILRTSERAQ